MLTAYWKCLLYLIRHKWYVYVAGRKLGVGRWQLLIHDLSKLLPDEFIPYAKMYYVEYPSKTKKKSAEWKFKEAWKAHVLRNSHHPEYYTRNGRSGKDMPDKYIREMVADWYGAGKAQGKLDEGELRSWWLLNKERVLGLIGEANCNKVEQYVAELS